MNPDPVGPWGVIAAVILVVLGVSVAACAAVVVIGRALRRYRFRLGLSRDGIDHVHDNAGRLWAEGPDGLFDLVGSADPAEQGWTYSQLDRVHGRLTRATPPESTTDTR
ncbi:hypothetical protein CLV43_114216 [Umezawaea tangerina]|uniref:Uncharacterized protein n=1 Tax=Umezawaea tangerina TaxID=84725 RepID=A0A2T0SPG4_9PSEU|nr:hypothetical protein CLV43_114216 [Umezawaea tangerina]